MKINIDWLRDFVPIDTAAEKLAEELTMAGLEVDSVDPVAPAAAGIVVAEILEKRAHPNADRLAICRISDGASEHEIVCGAPNAVAGIKVPFAPVGTVLPGGMKIKAAKIRGVESRGMLCSARELELSDDSAGLLILDDDAAPGTSLVGHLRLDDHVLDIDLTPNRGDCFSVLGIAREIAAWHGSDPLEEAQVCVEGASDRTHDVELVDTEACPRFAGRVVHGIRTGARSPDWMQERLRRAGLRPIHPVVDVTNYVMLELGQPLHAYRLDKLKGSIQVRFATAEEELTLLDGTSLELDEDALVIADDSGAIGLAGIMGGLSTAVDAETEAIFLESAYFAPGAIQGRARRYGMHTDASVRFERGVDPTGQERAVERASALLLEIAGGSAGPVVVAEDETELPQREPVQLRSGRISSLLGTDIEDEELERLLRRLGMQIEGTEGGWLVTPPSYRFDIAIEEDLIEEVGRMVGYDQIAVTPERASVHLGLASETQVPADSLADFLVARGYAEVVSFGFTEVSELAAIAGNDRAVRLANPISQDLNVMRSTLWPGLMRSARLNLSHQLQRCRIFEIGTVFEPDGQAVRERTCIAGLVTGNSEPVHWEGSDSRADFFDIKGDVEGLLSYWRANAQLSFETEAHPALNPTRSSAIVRGSEKIGWIGELHPALQADHDFKDSVVLFELDLTLLGESQLPKFVPYSRYPSSRRDLAVVVDDAVTAEQLTKHVIDVLGASLHRYEIFDVYRGKGVDPGRKSIGIGLILQDASRTLNDADTDDMIKQVMRRLETELGATIRT
ncbi:MAG: phenylalanine--tRNA ligase subunit beta [Gammaproteobacteria bacterium]|jgi:phenylalanyl-tRNA synthetase beta chain